MLHHQQLTGLLQQSHNSSQLPKAASEAAKSKATDMEPLYIILYLLLLLCEDKNVCSLECVSRFIVAHSTTIKGG